MKFFEKEKNDLTFAVCDLYFSEIKKLFSEICFAKDYGSRDCYVFDKEHIFPELVKWIQLDDKAKVIKFKAPFDFEKILALRWSYIFNTSVCYTRNTSLAMNRLLILLSLAYKNKLDSIQTPMITFYNMDSPFDTLPEINEENELVIPITVEELTPISQLHSRWLKQEFNAQDGYHIFYSEESRKYFIVCLQGKVFIEKINRIDNEHMEFIIERNQVPLEAMFLSGHGFYVLYNKLQKPLNEKLMNNMVEFFGKKISNYLSIERNSCDKMIHAPGKHYRILMPTAVFEDTVLFMDHSDENEGTPIRNLFLCNDGMSVNNALSVFKDANYDVMENKIKFPTSKILAEKREILLNEEESTRLLDKLPPYLQQFFLPNNPTITQGKRFITELQKLLRNMQSGAKSKMIFFKAYYEENTKQSCDTYVEYFKANVWDKISQNVLEKLEEIEDFKRLFDTYFGKGGLRCLDSLSCVLQTILLEKQVAILDIFNQNNNNNNNNNVSVFTKWKEEAEKFLEMNVRDCNSNINDGKTNLFLEELYLFISKYFEKNDVLFLLWIKLKMQLIQARQEEYNFLTKEIKSGSDTTVLSIFGELKKFLSKANFLKKHDCAMTVIFPEEILTEIPQDKIVVCQSQHDEKIYTVFIQGSQQNVAPNSPLHDSILELKQKPTDAQCYLNFIKELIKNNKLSFTTWAEKMVQFSLFCEIISEKIDKSILILIDQGKILGQMIQTAFLLAMKFDGDNQKFKEDWDTLGQYRIMIEEFIQALFNRPPLCKNIDNTPEFRNLISSIVDAVEKMNNPSVSKKLISILNNNKSDCSRTQNNYLKEKTKGLVKTSGYGQPSFTFSCSNENDI